MSDAPRHRATAPDPVRLTPLPEPDPAIRPTDNSGDPDAPQLPQDADWVVDLRASGDAR